MASLTTFHLPHRGAADPVWKKYFPGTPDDRFLFEALRRERVALQRHARKSGCWLILDPVERLENVYRRHGPSSVRARVSGLLHFLRDDSLPDVVVAINDDAERMSSVTLVGDWFSSEAVSSGGKRVIREAFFTRDALTVRQQIARKGPSTFWHPRNVGGPIVRETWVAPSSPKLGVPGTQVGVLTRSQSVISFETRGHRQMGRFARLLMDAPK